MTGQQLPVVITIVNNDHGGRTIFVDQDEFPWPVDTEVEAYAAMRDEQGELTQLAGLRVTLLAADVVDRTVW